MRINFTFLYGTIFLVGCIANDPLEETHSTTKKITDGGLDGAPNISQIIKVPYLAPLTNCQDFSSSFKAQMLHAMNEQLDRNLTQALINNAVNCYYPSQDAGMSMSGSGENSNGASQVSSTNNQVAGVDEADFVKNDNKYIYHVAGSWLRIFEAWPAAQTKQIAQVPVTGRALKLFVNQDRALIFSSTAPSSISKECTYGYDCDFLGDGSGTIISLFDITDRRSPILLREIGTNSTYINSRMINSAVHIVLNINKGISWTAIPSELSCNLSYSAAQIKHAYALLRQTNTTLINQFVTNDLLPKFSDVHYLNGKAEPAAKFTQECQDIFTSAENDGYSFTTVLSLNLANNNQPHLSSIFSKPGAVYASTDNLYFAVRHESAGSAMWYPGLEKISEASAVHRFILDNGNAPAAQYVASAAVKGHVLNQFSLDEWQGHLRVATTSGHVPESQVHSTMSIFNIAQNQLAAVGKLDNLAPQEDIRSVRFNQERGFIVTFKKTDPLFFLDLSVPTAPTVRAELKIPGFSTYLHLLDTNHILSVGYDAEDQGSFAYFDGVLLQLFDVSSPSALRLMFKTEIGTRGSSSEALTNHMAFNYFAPKSMLALPLTICENSSGAGSYGMNMTFSGVRLYSVDLSTGFSLKGAVSYAGATDNYCSSWWTGASSKVKRTIFMDDYLFSLSDNQLKVNSIQNPSVDLVTLPLQ